MSETQTMGGNDASTVKILKADDYQALSQARSGIDRARAEADETVAAAKAEAESILEAARTQAKAEASALVTEYLVKMQADLRAQEGQIAKLVSTALRRLLSPVPASERIMGTVRRALSETDIARGATLIVAPEHVAALRANFKKEGIPADLLQVVGDPDCPGGSTILRSDFGDIELGIELQLRAIERGLRVSRASAK